MDIWSNDTTIKGVNDVVRIIKSCNVWCLSKNGKTLKRVNLSTKDDKPLKVEFIGTLINERDPLNQSDIFDLKEPASEDMYIHVPRECCKFL